MYIYLILLLSKTSSILHSPSHHQLRLFWANLMDTLSCGIYFCLQTLMVTKYLILDWILDNDLHILNDGSATRTSCITGDDNIPDISLCASNWSAFWKLADPIGRSNHLPTVMEINHKIRYQPIIPVWPKRLSRKCEISSRNWTYLHASLNSTTFWYLQQPLKLGNQSWARNPNMDDSTPACELQSTFAIENPPKLIRMDWCMPWSHRGYKRGQDWNLKRFYARCNVELIWTKYVESHSVSDSPSHSTPDPNSPNEVISSYGCTITNIKTKVNIFLNQYAGVTNLNMSKADHDINWHFKKKLNAPSAAMKAVLHFKWMSCCLTLKGWRVKGQLTLTTFIHIFLNH